MQTSSGNCLVVHTHTHTHIYKYSLEGPSKECETLLHLFFQVIFAVTNQNFATNKTNRDVICGLHPASFVWSVRPTSFCCCGGNLTSWPRDGTDDTDDTDEPGHQTANFGAIAFAGSVCVCMWGNTGWQISVPRQSCPIMVPLAITSCQRGHYSVLG